MRDASCHGTCDTALKQPQPTTRGLKKGARSVRNLPASPLFRTHPHSLEASRAQAQVRSTGAPRPRPGSLWESPSLGGTCQEGQGLPPACHPAWHPALCLNIMGEGPALRKPANPKGLPQGSGKSLRLDQWECHMLLWHFTRIQVGHRPPNPRTRSES